MWQKNHHYSHYDGAGAEHWAWQFLRRNPDYQADWDWFNETWQLLEQLYGSPPDRNFMEWKNDSHAYRVVSDDDIVKARNLSGLKGQRLLIECWMGTKWGFYKFPVNPEIDLPELDTQLLWREVDLDKWLVMDGEQDSFSFRQIFDLRLPIEVQLEQAKRAFVIARRQQQKSGQLSCYRVPQCGKHGLNLLRIYDASNTGISESEIKEHLQLDNIPGLLAEAKELIYGGHQRILLYAE